ncbi:MAG: hypothetical protein M3258_04985 [Thermoproteota archaeon]|nr:hypothetical protein [Thermoproteota archaeon]
MERQRQGIPQRKIRLTLEISAAPEVITIPFPTDSLNGLPTRDRDYWRKKVDTFLSLP